MSLLSPIARRPIGWLIPVVLIPLVVLLVMQVRFLRKMADATVITERERLNGWLDDVTREYEVFYRTHATAALTLEPEQLAGSDPSFSALQRSEARSIGARTLFLMRFPQGEATETFFIDPATGAAKQPPIRQQHAIWIATASWSLLARKGEILPTPRLVVDERDPEHRILLRPVVDPSLHVTGVAGLVLDPAIARSSILPHKVERNIGRRFPDAAEREEVAVVVRDGGERTLWSWGRLQNPENVVTRPLPFVFTDWRLGIQGSCLTPEQLAGMQLRINLLWTGALALLLLGSLGLALRTAAKEIRLSQMKSDFVSNVSHELRTPLSSIRVFGEYMKLGRVRDPEKIREYGTYIETEGRRLTQLINNILDFSKIESAEKKYRFQRTDPAELVASIVGSFRLPLERGDVAIRLDAPSGPLPPVLADRDALGQALFNLLDNAVKYSGSASEVVIRLSTSAGSVRIAVTDRGIGIPSSEVKKIFEKFYRVGSGLVHDVKGSGLGLAIVEHVVRAHGGTVEVESRPGAGSTFSIVLPAAGAETDRASSAIGTEAGAET